MESLLLYFVGIGRGACGIVCAVCAAHFPRTLWPDRTSLCSPPSLHEKLSNLYLNLEKKKPACYSKDELNLSLCQGCQVSHLRAHFWVQMTLFGTWTHHLLLGFSCC